MGNELSSALRPALVMTVLFALLVGLAYPLALTGVGQVLFPSQANGSLVRDGDRVVGSSLIGQTFATARYFQGRPSAAGKGYDGMASSGSNLGPTSQALVNRVKTDVATRRGEGVMGLLPADLVTTSASGLDPDLSPASALAQVARIARERGLPEAQVRSLVASNVETSLGGVLGDPHLNVLALNRQLDRMHATQR